MKKVGIITMHRVYNYGSFFQAYATQKSVEDMGYQAEIIDYKYPNKMHCQKKSIKERVMHLANTTYKFFIPGQPYLKYLSRYKEAYSKYYKLGKKYESREEIINNPPEYDIYMAGSDQIWNDLFIKNDDTFFCGFAPKNKKRLLFQFNLMRLLWRFLPVISSLIPEFIIYSMPWSLKTV